MNTLIEKENIKVENMIYEIRGKQVMLDSELAKLYGVETKRINEAVKNNPDKFPERFSWIITKDELNIISRSKISTLNDKKLKRGQNIKYLPRVFTEQGVAMLATILKSKTATEISIQIMDAFVAMRRYISSSLIEQRYINELVLKNSKRIDMLEETFSGFRDKTNHLFFDGQVYDAYSLMMKIFDSAKKEIVLIDNYIDRKILDIVSKTEKKITIITNQYNNHDYTKYKKQYHNINLVINHHFHDRFIIIDKKVLYHCGASFKDLGKKCFAITKMEDEEYLIELLQKMG